MTAGISGWAFDDVYRSMNRDISADLPYGRLMRWLTIFMARYQLIDPVIRAAKHNPELRSALYDAVSAHGPYKGIMRRVFRPSSIQAVTRSLLSKPADLANPQGERGSETRQNL
jgi:hypothetical protein